eukprot:PhM_4_TR16469/c0_g1_i1/m.82904
MRFSLLLLLVAIIATSAQAVTSPRTHTELLPWLCGGSDMSSCASGDHFPTITRDTVAMVASEAKRRLSTVDGMMSMYELFHSKDELADPRLRAVMNATLEKHISGKQVNAGASFTPSGSNPYPYFAFFPKLVASLIPDGKARAWSGLCFQNAQAYSVLSADKKNLIVTIDLEGGKSLLCSDNFLLMSVAYLGFQGHFFHGANTLTIDVSAFNEDEMWDLETKGLRVFMFQDDTIQLLYDISNTVALFHSDVTPTATDADHNMYFLEHYAQLKPVMTPRNSTIYSLPAEYIQSGDFIGVVRFDGLDPMLAWAMGSTTGHTVVAMRDSNSSLFFCESTVNSTYWPVNGVQCTEYNEWIRLANLAGYNAVVVPLRADLRAKFNATAAWEFFATVRGLDYGYRNLIYGWIDTVKDNYPCLPPDFSDRCLTWDFVEVMFAYLEKVVPAASIIFSQAWNKRMGTSDLKAAAIYRLAGQRGMNSSEINAIVEQDSWVYNTTRDGLPAVGKSQVCCVFVCNMWKAGGVFGDLDFNCAEQTNVDDYSLDIFDAKSIGQNRPDVCKSQDPQSDVCQLTGSYTLHLNELNSKAPYAHMREKCPSLAPNYTRPADC